MQTATEINTRKALEEASKGRDLFELKAALESFEKQGLKEDAGDFSKASLKIEYLELAKGMVASYDTVHVTCDSTECNHIHDHFHPMFVTCYPYNTPNAVVVNYQA